MLNFLKIVMDLFFTFIISVGWGLLASPLGIWLSKFLNKWGCKIVLAGLLIINSITMITTSSLALIRPADSGYGNSTDLRPPMIHGN